MPPPVRLPAPPVAPGPANARHQPQQPCQSLPIRGILWGVSDALAIDEIVLKVPATAACGRIVRVGAAAVALRQGMSFTEIDELRAAMDQATALLLTPPAGPDATIVCVLRTQGGRLEVDLERTDGASVPATDAARFKKAADASNVTATVESERGRLLMRMDIGRPGSRPAA